MPERTQVLKTRSSSSRRSQIQEEQQGNEDVILSPPLRSASVARRGKKDDHQTLIYEVDYVRRYSVKQLIVHFLKTPIIWAYLIIVFLFLRLVFSQGGVNSFYHKSDELKEIGRLKRRIEAENDDLKIEIHRLKYDANYQIQAARDNLGVIAPDEYLVLFAKESSGSKIKEE